MTESSDTPFLTSRDLATLSMEGEGKARPLLKKNDREGQPPAFEVPRRISIALNGFEELKQTGAGNIEAPDPDWWSFHEEASDCLPLHDRGN